MTASPSARLLASIHDVAPCFEGQVDRLADVIEGKAAVK